MPRFFVDKTAINDEHISIQGEDFNHIKNVLRMNVGEDISVSDGEGTDYYGHIEAFEKGEVCIKIDNSWASFSELPSKIYLYQGMPKSTKMELIIQKAVELGVYEIIPVMTERTVVKLDDKGARKKTERFNAISEAAAKQAGRGFVPTVKNPISFKEAVKAVKDIDIKLIPYEKAEGMDKAREIVDSIEKGQNIAIFIGPEGGFSEQEIKLASENGILPMTLGHRILRTETAGMTLLSIIMFRLDN